MQTSSCIPSFSTDNHLISHSALIPNPATGLKNSHDNSSIAILLPADSALPLPGAAEHNLPAADENLVRAAELLLTRRWVEMDLGGKWQVWGDICELCTIFSAADAT